VNGSAAAILGYAREELIGRDMHRLIHYSHANGAPYPAENCPIYRALLEGRGTRVEDEFFYRSDGSGFPVEYSSYPIEEQGAILGLIVTFTDITARKRAEESLRAAEAKYRGLFEHISEGVYQTSPNGELLAANPALVRMLGYDSELELRALDVNDLYADPEDRRKFAEQLEREGRLSDAPLRLRRKDGKIITVLENARAVRDERTNVLYYEGTLSLSRDSDPAPGR
jgi:PAS domain S-box-containing protein